jgi:hypothetical protein
MQPMEMTAGVRLVSGSAIVQVINIATMASFWQQITQLFQSAASSTPEQPAVHELLVRDERVLEDYNKWKQSLVLRRLLNWLGDQYAIYCVLPQDIDQGLDFLNTPSSQGFVVYFNRTNYSLRETSHFLDYLKERVLTLDYKSQLSDVKTYMRAEQVETTERHYLKPRPKFDTAGCMLQQFGNVLIELVIRDGKPQQLRFQATTYRDHNYLPPASFRELMQLLLD